MRRGDWRIDPEDASADADRRRSSKRDGVSGDQNRSTNDDVDGRDDEREFDTPDDQTEGGLSPDEQREILAGDPVRVPIEPEIDLHSFLPSEIKSVVEEYLEEAVSAGFAEVKIIHGRGIGFWRERIRELLANSPHVISYRDAPPGFGGWGATIVRLRV
jgi:DNA-nicking Smr family endonuclease